MLFADLFSSATETLGMVGLMVGVVIVWMFKNMGGVAKGVAQKGAASWIGRLFK
jgi:hypothetical protein